MSLRLVRSPLRLACRSFATKPAQPKNDAPLVAKRPLRLLIMGSPGSGKGTQTERIQKNFKVEALSSGDLLRVNIAQGTEIGKLASKIIKEGGLVPDETMISLVLNELPKYSSMTWMLDGFPRTRQQAEKLDKELEKVGPLDHVINLDVPAEVILKRIEDRWVHIPSGRVYNLSYNPPKVAGKDDVTGEPLSKRPDDNLETFKKRLDAYYGMTKPLADYYAAQGKLRNFAGETSDEIYPKIHAEMMKWFTA